MHPDLQTVKELQEIDRQLAGLKTRLAAIPLQLKKIEDQLSSHLKEHEAHKTRLTANQKERRDLEGEIQMTRAKISKHRDQLYELKSNEQYKAMLHEIEGEESKIAAVEDRILEKMMETDQLEKLVREAAARLDVEKQRVAAEKKDLEGERDADIAVQREAQERRRALAATVSATTMVFYERALKTRGNAVVPVVDASCSGCYVKLRPQYYNEVRADDELHTCENCGRILYAPEPSVGEDIGQGTRVEM